VVRLLWQFELAAKWRKVNGSGSVEGKRKTPDNCNQHLVHGVNSGVLQIFLNKNMKSILVTVAILSTLQLVAAQERLSREEALRYAAVVSADLKQLKGTPIATDVDTQKPVALRDEDYGGMVLPQKDLSAESLTKAGKEEIVPIGQLWLHKLAPMCDGEVVSNGKLRLVTVSADGTEATVPQCALGVRRNAQGALEMAVFGKGEEPLLIVPLKAIDTKQELPLDLAAERESDSGRLTVKILGKYQATFPVTALDI
jgi:hypothetical protein